jgi:very-short-patch-repair endonuclease
MRGLLGRAQLPAPRINTKVLGLEVDLFWPEERLVAEVDGFAFHGSRERFEEDRRRDADLVAAGYSVQRITWRQLVHESEAVVARFAAALALARAGLRQR